MRCQRSKIKIRLAVCKENIIHCTITPSQSYHGNHFSFLYYQYIQNIYFRIQNERIINLRHTHLIILVFRWALKWFIFRIFTVLIKVNPKIIQKYEKMLIYFFFPPLKRYQDKDLVKHTSQNGMLRAWQAWCLLYIQHPTTIKEQEETKEAPPESGGGCSDR